ncbi:MAG: hypothetical protein DHS20C16_13310 [Phycisphaerae bacterium]|nr:MAG: hypothetical protein DHS20C16_13310 [Phycisphaerae bacterium]
MDTPIPNSIETPTDCPAIRDDAKSANGTWGYRITAYLILGATVILAHGWSLHDGLGLDDHWHYRTIRESGWSFPELLDATTIRSEELYDLWWQDQPVQFQYSRPLSVALMKVVYAITGGSVLAQHMVNLALHWIAAILVSALCYRMTRFRFWSIVGGILFVVYPLSVNAVAWPAAQNMILQTALLLGAMLAYARASNLDMNITATKPATVASRMNNRWLALAVMFWVGALSSRENAIVLPAILVAMDVAFGGWKFAWSRRIAYVIFAVLGVAFLIWRLGYYYEPMPDVYVRRSSAPGFFLWCAAKLLHFVCSTVWASPMTVGPTGRLNPFTEAPFDIALMLVIVVGVAATYFTIARRARGFWIWPLWILLTMAPMIPVLATPHSAYICGVAVAIGLILGPVSAHRRKARRTYVATTTLAIVVIGLSVGMLKVNRLLWKGLLYGEKFVAASLRAKPVPGTTTDVYFINLPFAAIYAKEHIVDANHLDHDVLKCHVLTFAPQLPRMSQPSSITQLDAHRFSLIVETRPYFSRLLGRFLIDGFRSGGQLQTGDRFSGDGFDVEVAHATEEGVYKLDFSFEKPLTAPNQVFFVSSEECGAMQIKFLETPYADTELPELPTTPDSLDTINAAAADIVNGNPNAADILFAATESPLGAIQIAASNQLKNIVQPIAIATASDTLHVFDDSKISESEVLRLRKWWHASINSDDIAQVFSRRNELQEIRHRRDELKRGRALIARFIKCDLYLTGKPFPGPLTKSPSTPASE